MLSTLHVRDTKTAFLLPLKGTTSVLIILFITNRVPPKGKLTIKTRASHPLTKGLSWKR